MTRPLQVEGQEAFEGLFVAEVMGSAVGVKGGMVEFLVGRTR
jgi:hypothetical protein